MQAMISSASSSSTSPLSHSDSQFCMTESVAIGRPRRTLGALEKTMVERQCAEVESDSDSGKGTILSDNLESPIRDSPPLFHASVHNWNGSPRFPAQRNPNGRTNITANISADHEELYGLEYGKEDTIADAYDSCPVSPASGIGFGLESPSAVARLSGISRRRGISGSVEENSHRVQSAEAEIANYSAEELLTSRFSFVDPGFPGVSDKNNNYLPVRLSPGRNAVTAMTHQRLAIVSNDSDQRHLSYNKDGGYLNDSKETITTFYKKNNDDDGDDDDDDDDDMRQQLKARCQYLFGSRSGDFGSREMNYSRFGSGQEDVGVGYSDYEHAPTVPRGDSRRNCTSIFAGNATRDLFRSNDDDDVTGASPCRRGYHDTVGGYRDNRRQSNNFSRPSLNDPLSCTTLSATVVRKDWCPASNPSEYRGNTGHQMAAGFERCESASNRLVRARRRWQETSFNSTIETDPAEEEEAAASPDGLPPPSPRAAEYLRSRSVPYGREPAELPWKCERAKISPAVSGFEASWATLPPRPNKVPWGARVGGEEPAVVQTTPLPPGNDRRRHHTVRRWTNPGPEEEEEMDHPAPSNPNPKSTRRTEFDFSISKRQPRSTTSIAPEDGPWCEGGTRRPTRSDLEMVDFDPSSKSGSSVPSTPSTRTDGSLSRGSSFPGPDGRSKPASSSGISLFQKIRSRLTGRRRDDSLPTTSGTIVSTDQQHFGARARHHDAAYDPKQQHQGTSAQDDRPRIGCDGVPGDDAGPVVKATGMLLRFNSLQEESADDKESTERAKKKNFSTLQHQKSNAEVQTKSWTDGHDTAKRMPTSNSHVNTAATAAAEAAAATTTTTTTAATAAASDSIVRCQPAGGQIAAPSGEVAVTLSELDELVSLVDAHAARVPETGVDRTISEEEFDEYRRAMIDALKDFIENCKLMVIRTPASSSAAVFADDIGRCSRLLGVVVDRYGPLVDCSSLPADRARFAGGVGAVATSYRDMVVAASAAVGLTAKHPAVRALRARSGRLVVDLTDLMRMVRGMNYNGISRRF